MASPSLIRTVKRRPHRWAPPNDPRELQLVTREQLRPARYTVGYDPALLPEGFHEDPWRDFDWSRPASAPMNREALWCRVEEVNEHELVATAWTWPAGQELILDLPIDGRILTQDGVRVGDLLIVWTWRELPGADSIVDVYLAKVIRRVLDDGERERLRETLSPTVDEPE